MNGAGVKIGVLSDSFNNLGGWAADVASGDLPGPGNPNGFLSPVILVGSGDLASGGSDEGRAMLQIVHDLAPGAQLYFATAFNSEADFANNIRALRTAGCQVIVDDVYYYVESALHDGQAPGVSSPLNMGVITQAVNDVTAAGALYFSSAGNDYHVSSGSGVWEGDWASGGNLAAFSTFPGGEVLDWDKSASTAQSNQLTYQGGPVSIQWADPLGTSSNDYDLFVMNSGMTAVILASTNVQNGINSDPQEILFFGVSAGRRLVVLKKAGAAARFLSVNTFGASLTYATNGTTRGHACAANGFGVAATPAAADGCGGPAGPYPSPFVSTNRVECFSSDGFRRTFYNPDGTPITPGNFSSTGGILRTKPDITAADGVSTSVPGFATFYGTSAASPHAGAIAALILSRNPILTSGEVRAILQGNALDIEGPGIDDLSGYGILQAYQSVQAACTPFTGTVTGGGAICGAGSSTVTVTVTGGAPPYTVTLTNGGGTLTGPSPLVFTVSPASTTTYTISSITATGGCSGSGSGSATVTVNATPPAQPTITPGGPTTFCAGGSVTLSSSSATGNQWYLGANPIGGATSQTYSATASGSYTVVVTANGCPSPASAATVVTVNPIPAQPTISGPSSVCAGNQVTLDAGPGYASYSWAPGGQTSQVVTVTPTAPSTTYTVTVQNAQGCSASGTKTVTVLPVVGPASITTVGALCQGETAVATTTASGANLTYYWSITNYEGFAQLEGPDDGTSLKYRAVSPGRVTIELAVTPPGGCTTILTADVNVLPMPATPVVTAPSSVKTGETGIQAAVTATPGSTFAWSLSNGTITGGQGTAVITFDAGQLGSATLEVIETNASGCKSRKATKTMTVAGAAGPCTPDGTTLCLNDDRFKVTVAYVQPAGAAAKAGQAVSFQPAPNDSGWFWFFTPTNMELLVKVLDGRGVNGKFWVLYGALSDVEYTITVLDTVTGATKVYTSQAGTMASAADVDAFEDSPPALAPLVGLKEAVLAGLKNGQPISVSELFAAARVEVPAQTPPASASASACTPDATTLCLNGNRFQARVHWQVELPIGTDGPGVTVPVTADTGCFWFFEPQNIELALKVLDGTEVNGFYWVLYGALSDVAYTIEVTDTKTGAVRTFAGTKGIMASKADTEAFPTD